MHYLLRKLDITRHDSVKCHKLNLAVSRKQLLALQNIHIIFYHKVHKGKYLLGDCDHMWHECQISVKNVKVF